MMTTQLNATTRTEEVFHTSEQPKGLSSSTCGIIFMLLAILSFAISNIFIKGSSDYYPIGQMVVLRGFVFLFPWAIYLLFRHRLNLKKILYTPHLPTHIMQGIFSAFCLYFLFYAFKVMPLSDATAISFAETFILTALSVPLLREQVGLSRWVAVFVGFIGVLIVTQPTLGTLTTYTLGALSCLLGVTFDAVVLISLRKVGQTDGATTIITYYVLFSTLAGFLFFPIESWVTLSPDHIWDILGLGIFGALGQIFVTHAFKKTEAATLAPLIYTLLIWSLLFDEIIWGHIPSLTVCIGTAIIVSSGLYIYRYNTKSRSNVC